MTREQALTQAQAALKAKPVQTAQLVALEESYPGITLEAAEKNHADGEGLEGFEAFPLEPEPDQDTLVDAQVDARWKIPSDAIDKPATLADLVALIQRCADDGVSIRPLGSGYSQSNVTDPADDNRVMSTALFGEMLALDTDVMNHPSRAPSLYKCHAGRTVGQVIADLDADGRALPNMGAGTFQAIMGAIQTCTHGSGGGLPAFPDLVQAMTFVTVIDGKATVVELEREGAKALSDPAKFAAKHANDAVPVKLLQSDDAMNAAVVSMGTMGIAFTVTIEVQPQYWLLENRTVEWWSDLKGDLLSQVAAYRNFELLVDPWPRTNEATGKLDHQILVTRRKLVDSTEDKGSRPILMSVAKTAAGRAAAGVAATYAMRNPLARVPGVLNTGIHSTAVTDYQRRSYEVLLLQLDVNAVAEEVGVPIANAVEAAERILANAREHKARMEALLGSVTGNPYHRDFDALTTAWSTAALHTSPFSMRFVSSSDAWIAMPYQQDTCMIEMPMTGSDHLDQALGDGQPDVPRKDVQLYQAYVQGRENLWKTVEAKLADLKVRPHWGLWNSVGPDVAAQRYPKWNDWAAMVRKYNASGVFDSPFTTRMGLSARDDAGDDVQRGLVVLRMPKSAAHLKVKEAPGWAIFNALTEAEVSKSIIKGEKRLGKKVIGSTEDLVDPVVCEFVFDHGGTLQPAEWKLFHSFTVPRYQGTATLNGDLLTISGDAAVELRKHLIAGGRVGTPEGCVVLKQNDAAKGRWVIQDPPRR